MVKDHIVRFASMRRRTLAVALMASVVSLVVASSVLALEPTGDFARFAQCPRFAPATAKLCLFAQISGGEVTINKLTVPITRPITLQGGEDLNEETGQEKFVAALDGETLANTPQPVPGGLSGLLDCDEIREHRFKDHRFSDYRFSELALRRACKEFEHRRILSDAYETVELARPTSEIGISRENDLFQEGSALTLPVKIHLENPLLGSHCYIGSSAEPIMFEMTSGTTNPPPPNKPIHGSVGGPVTYLDDFTIVELNANHFLVNNTFSAPAATGCGGHLAFMIDPVIDHTIGLPSPSGYNTVTHSGPGFSTTVESVLHSEH